jgi:hypothetical protein
MSMRFAFGGKNFRVGDGACRESVIADSLVFDRFSPVRTVLRSKFQKNFLPVKILRQRALSMQN